jgi:hypothetical protein
MATPAKDEPGTEGAFATDREDLWWVAPVVIALGFTAFIVYSTYRALYAHVPAALQLSFLDAQTTALELGIYTGATDAASAQAIAEATGWSVVPEYLSPFYSPCLGEGCGHGFLAGLIPISIGTLSPAFYILWAPLGFRATCYYYRKAYYRAYFADPPACAVEEPRHDYKGETGLLLLQNLHRWFVPFSLALILFLGYDAIFSFQFHTASGETVYGIGLGSIIMLTNVVLLAGYTFGCHALRHLVGGGKDCMTCPKGEQTLSLRAWSFVNWFNKRHMMWAWLSLFWVAFTDFYVWMIASGTLDPIVWTF